jgi:prolyl-tRNA synthetase
MYARWVQSYRDLPILINQWANVVRWEMRTRLFLRTAEFLWQEGHTVHATADEAMVETLKMLDVYADFAENWLGTPVIKGEKTADERFPGAVNTYSIEAMMQDRKALQAGTSHFLGQNFAKASKIKFLDKTGKEEFAWTTSWGVSTRLIGSLIMTHSDDDGLVLPPKLAPKHVVIIPIYKEAERAGVLEYCDALAAELKRIPFADQTIQVEVDDRDVRGGEKAWHHIKRGVPIRLEIGPRDVAAGGVFVGRRDQSPKDKKSMPKAEFIAQAAAMLDEMQKNLFNRALKLRSDNTKAIDSFADFTDFFGAAGDDEQSTGVRGGFAMCHYSDDPADQEAIAAKLAPLKVSARNIPLDGEREKGTCPFTGKPSERRIVFARSY